MSTGTIACLVMAVLFFIFALIFALLEERVAILISGFNSFSKEKRAKYDQIKISRDMRNRWFLWTGLFAVGAILSHFISQTVAIFIFVIWGVLFIREVHFDTEKAFGKYKL